MKSHVGALSQNQVAAHENHRYKDAMAHTKPEQLCDIKNELAELRKLAGLVERKPGIFYFKSTSFLHFHGKDGVRWADVKVGNAWKRLDLNFSPSAAARAKFLKGASAAHRTFLK